MFREENSVEELRLFLGSDSLILLKHRTTWVVKEKGYDVKLEDFNCATRQKKVTYAELMTMKKVDEGYYRSPEYYDMLINILKERSQKEKYCGICR